MSTAYRRLRRTMPWLTPTYAGDDDVALRVPPLDPELLTTTADIVPTIPLLNRRPLNLVPFDETAPPPPIAGLTRMPTRLSDEQVDEIGAPPMVIRRDGRPTTQFIGEGTPEERLTTRRQALEQYQPQKESKKSLLLRTLLGQLRGGLVGEGGSLDTLLGPAGILDRRGKDRAWQQGQLAQTDEQLGRMRTDRRQTLQDELLAAQVQRAQSPPPVKPPKLIRIPDPNDPSRDILVPERPNLQIPVRDKPPALQRPQIGRMRENGVVYQTEYDPESKRWRKSVDAEGQPIVVDEVKAGADVAPIKREAFEQEVGDLESQKLQLQADAQRYTQEANVYDSWRTDPSKTEDQRIEAVREAQRRRAEVDRINAQIRQLDRGIATARRQARSQGAPHVNPTRTSGGSGLTEQAIRDAAKAKNLDPDAAVKRARARGMIR